MPPWLPGLITLEQHGGDWDAYLAAAYAVFCADFLGIRPDFEGKRLGLKRYPIELGKEATFWHFVSSGAVEVDRDIDLRRLERIAWPRAIIDNRADNCVKRWTERRKEARRIHLWCEDAMYLVVLDEHGDYVLPWTAYPIQHNSQARKLNRRWEDHSA